MHIVEHNYRNGFKGVLRPKNQSILKGENEDMRTYRNGSTKETVYQDSDFSIPIGALDPYEECLGTEIDGKVIVVYDTIYGYKKTGFVKWKEGLTK